MVDEATSDIISVVLFLTISLCAAGLFETLPSRVLSICSNSVMLLLLTMVFGLIQLSVDDTSAASKLITTFEISPEGIQLLFLPPLIFSEMFKTNAYVFTGVLFQTCILAFAGVCVATVLTALFPLYILPESWSWYLSIAFGGTLSATDPVAVLAALHALGASTKLSTIIGGESVLNDGSAIVIVTLFLALEQGEYLSTWDIFAFIFREVLGSLALGVAFGLAQIACYFLLRDQPTPLVAFTFSLPYICFAAALLGDMSGVLSLVTLGLMANIWGKIYIKGAVAHRMEAFWEQAEFIANSWLFAISGLLIASDLLFGDIIGSDWGYLFLLYILLLAIRFVSIILFFPVMRKQGYGFTLRECIMTWWGGLRGAVGLTLALTIRSVAAAQGEARISSQATFFMGGIVVLTSIINASTTGVLLKWLHLEHLPNPFIVYELESLFRESAIACLIYAGADKREICLPPLTKPQGVEIKGALHASRRHFLLAQNASYDALLNKDVINGVTWVLLKHSIDRELDIYEERIDQWKNIVESTSIKLLTWYLCKYGSPTDCEIIEFLYRPADETKDIEEQWESLLRLETSSEETKEAPFVIRILGVLGLMAYSYLHAHDLARRAIKALQSKDDNLRLERESLIQESLDACVQPALFLRALRATRPVILEHIKSFQLTTSIKWTLFDRVFDLYELGLLEESETAHLLKYSIALSKKCAENKLALQNTHVVTPAGLFDKNPDLYPFPPLNTIPEEGDASIEDEIPRFNSSLMDGLKNCTLNAVCAENENGDYGLNHSPGDMTEKLIHHKLF